MKIDRQGAVEACLAGATAGIFAACVNISARYASDPGDILGFFGGAFGAGAAVVGARWLEQVKGKQRDVDEHRQILAALLQVNEHIVRLKDREGIEFTAGLISVEQGYLLIDRLIERFSSNNFSLRVHLTTLRYWIEIELVSIKAMALTLRSGAEVSKPARDKLVNNIEKTGLVIRRMVRDQVNWPNELKEICAALPNEERT